MGKTPMRSLAVKIKKADLFSQDFANVVRLIIPLQLFIHSI